MGFATGLSCLVRGFRIVYSSRRLALLGMLPALVTGLLFLGGLVALVFGVDELVGWMTPFAETWADWVRVPIRVLAGIAILGAAVGIGVVTFAAVTLLIGGPFYERLAAHVDRTVDPGGGEAEGLPESGGRSWGRDLADSLTMVAISVVVGALLLGLGFVPVVGQTVVPVLAALVGGWLLAVEVIAVTFDRRGLGLADRRRAVRSRATLALGFGVPAYLLLAVPLVAIIAMPGVVAGGALLAREVRPARPTPAADRPERA
ncbi:MAG TPA: EI24 domain-containing protein [Actinopolymorphaceae bacterium]